MSDRLCLRPLVQNLDRFFRTGCFRHPSTAIGKRWVLATAPSPANPIGVGGGGGGGLNRLRDLVLDVLLPKGGDQLACNPISGVLGDEAQDEAPVAPQIDAGEATDIGCVSGQFVVYLTETVGDVSLLEAEEDGDDDPLDEAADGDGHHEDHPEPEEDEHHLVEEIQRQGALDRVPVDVAELAHVEVAERDAREARRRRPLLAVGHSAHHVEAVQVVVGSEKGVEQEELTDDVDDVQHLDDQVYDRQVAAVDRQSELLAQTGSLASSTESVQELTHSLTHIAHVVFEFVVPVSLALDRCVGDRVDGQTGLLVEDAPDGARQVEEESLEAEDEGDPLVVADDWCSTARLLGQLVFDWNVVRIRRPTYLQINHQESQLYHMRSNTTRPTNITEVNHQRQQAA